MLASQLKELDRTTFTEADMNSLTDCLQAFFSRDVSIMRNVQLFCLFFVSFNAEIVWLDEIAQGLKFVLAAINSAVLSLKRLSLDQVPDLDMSKNNFVVYLENVLRQMSYTLGFVAGRLIQQDESEFKVDDTLGRLNILQGGFEDRFIPVLSETTKT